MVPTTRGREDETGRFIVMILPKPPQKLNPAEQISSDGLGRKPRSPPGERLNLLPWGVASSAPLVRGAGLGLEAEIR